MRAFGKGQAISAIIQDEALFIAFAELFHFTPSEVRGLTLREVQMFVEYLAGKGYAIKQEQARARLKRFG